MKKFYSLLAVVAMTATVNAQSENIGTGATGNPSVATYTNYQNSGTWTFAGTADIRTTTPSTTYNGASGGNNVFFAAAGGRTFTISGINTSALSTVGFSFGWLTTTATAAITVEYSTDGTNFTAITVPVNATANSWNLKTFDGILPKSSSLVLRFTAPATGSGMRLDDIVISEKATMAVVDATKGKATLVKNTIVSNELIFGAAAKVYVYNTAGQVVKAAEVAENGRLDVSSLAKGTYVVTGIVNGQTVSQKIIKK